MDIPAGRGAARRAVSFLGVFPVEERRKEKELSAGLPPIMATMDTEAPLT
jgi:hypothetical protein